MAFAGPKNRKGENGIDGANGADGSVWHSGEGVPDKSLGKKGDFYFDEITCDIYRKQTKEWLWVANNQGAPGKTGRAGRDGKDGKDGITKVIYSGSLASSSTDSSSSFDVDTILSGYNSAGELAVLVNELGNVLVDSGE